MITSVDSCLLVHTLRAELSPTILGRSKGPLTFSDVLRFGSGLNVLSFFSFRNKCDVAIHFSWQTAGTISFPLGTVNF